MTTKQLLWSLVILAASCFATNRLTERIALANAKAQCGKAIEFDDRKTPLLEFVANQELSDGEALGEIPAGLIRAGVTRVARRGRFILFRLASTSLIPTLDAANSYYVCSLDRTGGAVEELMQMVPTKLQTYHIQYLRTPGWYYWQVSDSWRP